METAVDEFLRELWSFWLVVGIAPRRVRSGATSEKMTVILQQLWARRRRLTIGPYDESAIGYWPEREALWMQRSQIRSVLRLPENQFADDDAVDVFYRGHAFYDRMQSKPALQALGRWRWRIPGISKKLPEGLRDYVSSELSLDVDKLSFAGMFFDGYDDATIWIGRSHDPLLATRLRADELTPSQRVEQIRGEFAVEPPPPVTPFGAMLALTLGVANQHIDHKQLLDAVVDAVVNERLPEYLRSDALRLLLFRHPDQVFGTLRIVRALVNRRWDWLGDVFRDQTERNVLAAKTGFLALFTALYQYGLYEECLELWTVAPPKLIDPPMIVLLLKRNYAGISPGQRQQQQLALVRTLVTTLEHSSSTTDSMIDEVRFIVDLAKVLSPTRESSS